VFCRILFNDILPLQVFIVEPDARKLNELGQRIILIRIKRSGGREEIPKCR
jgi:hypothetical protein